MYVPLAPHSFGLLRYALIETHKAAKYILFSGFLAVERLVKAPMPFTADLKSYYSRQHR